MPKFILAFIFFFQLPDLPTPTPWQSPTPMPTAEVSIGDAQEILATTDAQQYTFESDGEQSRFNGQAILPNLNSAQVRSLFSYMKWTVSGGAQSVFGPFSPLLIPMGILILLAFISLFVYFWENLIVTAIKISGFVINTFLRLFGR